MRVRVYYQPNGSVVIYRPTDWAHIEECHRRVFADRLVKAGSTWEDLDYAELPPREHRNRWRKNPNGSGVIVADEIPAPRKRGRG